MTDLSYRLGPSVFVGNPVNWNSNTEVLQQYDAAHYRARSKYYIPEVFRSGVVFEVQLALSTISGVVWCRAYSKN